MSKQQEHTAQENMNWLEALENAADLSDASSVYSVLSDASSNDSMDEPSVHGDDLEGNSFLPQWRLETFSDYVIHVVHSDATDTYRVHKVMLVTGAVHSDYLRSLFSSSFQENTQGVSTFQFPPKAAQAFPDMLDFIYSDGRICTLELKSVGGVFHLAEYFGVPALEHKIQEFIAGQLAVDTKHWQKVYSDAVEFRLDKLVHQVEEFWGNNILSMDPEPDTFHVLSVESMVEIISSEHHLRRDRTPGIAVASLGVPPEVSIHLSRFVCSYIQARRPCSADFTMLTQKDYLPVIDENVAVTLIQLEEDICNTPKTGETCLQQRCYQALKKRLREVDFEESKHEFLDFLRSHPSKSAVNMLIAYIKDQKSSRTRWDQMRRNR